MKKKILSEIKYYNRLEETDKKLEELAEIKKNLIARLNEERDRALLKAKLHHAYMVEVVNERFSQSVDKVLGKLGETIPDEAKDTEDKK